MYQKPIGVPNVLEWNYGLGNPTFGENQYYTITCRAIMNRVTAFHNSMQCSVFVLHNNTQHNTEGQIVKHNLHNTLPCMVRSQ